MGITVECDCGEIYGVNENMAGKKMKCRACNDIINISVEEEIELIIEPARRIVKPRVDAVAKEGMVACPMCAEMIQGGSSYCPKCDEEIKASFTKEQKSERLSKVLAGLDEYLVDEQQVARNKKQMGALVSVRTIVVFVLLIVGLGLYFAGGNGIDAGDNSAAFFFGILMIAIFLPSTLGSFYSDWTVHNIQTAKSPKTAVKRFFKAVKTGREKKSYGALTPTAKNAGLVESLSFEDIPYNETHIDINGMEGFAEYWRFVFKAVSGYTRLCALQQVKIIEQTDEMAVVAMTFAFTSYDNLAGITRANEKKHVAKLLIKRAGKWFFAEAEVEGVLDDPGVVMLGSAK